MTNSEHGTDNADKTDMSSLEATIKCLMNISACKNEERETCRTGNEESYNIFDILNIATDEVNGHSRFLHHLLSPQGSHGMGDAFLKAFFSQILHIDSEPWMSEVRVSREVAFEDGRLDILIDYPNTCCIVIEVKVYASDQYRQLERYKNYIDQWKNKNPEASIVEEFYLTLDGRDASDFSVGESDIDYKPLSFRDDIVPWLERCVELSSSKTRISETIKQYFEIVNRLTRSRRMDSEFAYIVEKVGESQSSYEAAAQIADSLPFVRTQMLIKMFKDIEDHLEKRFPAESNLTTNSERADITKYYNRYERRRPYPRLKFKLKEDEDRVLAFVVELGYRLWIGVVFFKKADNQWGFERIDEEREWLYQLSSNEARDKWNALIDEAPSGDWWLDWRFKEAQPTGYGCIDFNACSSDENSQFEYSDLFDSQKYESFIKCIHDEIDEYLSYLKELGVLD